jgi:calreticulin
MKAFKVLSAILLFFLFASAEVYFEEDFDEGWEERWVISQNKAQEGTLGEFGLATGKFSADPNDKGLQTKQDARFYQISAEIKEFSNEGHDLVIQYTVKHDQDIDCGGAYIKLLPEGLDQSDFNGNSEYNIMFGPDVCGATKRTHAILTYKGKNHLIKRDVNAERDTATHLYTFVLRPDQTFEILIDNKQVRSGSIIDEWDVLPPKEIKDPSASKPADWVDEATIDDPEAVKPEGWDDIPAQIVDPDASKPDDWDTELDGEWEPPMMANPEYQGEWKAPRIPNPEYKGAWVHPMIANPDYAEDPNVYAFPSHKYVGIEIWQVKSGTIFDKMLITDDVQLASERAERIMEAIAEEKAAKKADDEAKAAAAKAAAEANNAGAEDGEDNEGEEDGEWAPEESHEHDEL